MTAISSETRTRIHGYLDAFIENLITDYRERRAKDAGRKPTDRDTVSKTGELKPFHEALLPAQLKSINQFERSLSTILGSTFEECARLIALENHREARRGYAIRGSVSLEGIAEVERQRVVFEHAADQKGRKPTLDAMVSSVLNARRDGDLEERVVTADLLVVTHGGREFFFEIKSPKPNKGQCLEIIERLLRYHLLRDKGRPEAIGYFAMAYNPFGNSRADYKWSFARNYYPRDDGLLIGDEFWQLIGGATCYEELLRIYREVGAAKGKRILDALAYGF